MSDLPTQRAYLELSGGPVDGKINPAGVRIEIPIWDDTGIWLAGYDAFTGRYIAPS